MFSMKDKKVQTLFIILLVGGLSFTSILPGQIGSPVQQTFAADGAEKLKKQAKEAVQKLSSTLTGPLSRMDVNAINERLEKFVSDAAEKGQPVDFGIGIVT